MEKLVERYKNRIDLQGDYVEKWYYSYIHLLIVTSIKVYADFSYRY